MKNKEYLLIVMFLTAQAFNGSINAQNSWLKKFPTVGTFSSPRVTDLNGDNVKDIILGAGREEFQACDSAVVAVNGKNGDLIWKVSAKDQIFGSASFMDINEDGIDDVFIGGRSAELISIDGRTGNVIWRFKTTQDTDFEWFNFYNPQFIPDQNNDGQEDILVSNGGNVLAEPHKINNRPAGYLVILDSKNGKLISMAKMPDNGETYMSVSVLPNQPKKFKNVIFGTGGETIGGNLFVTSIEEIMSGDLSESVKLATSNTNGFVGPAAWVDITGDGKHDIVTNAVDGRLLAFNGQTHKLIWEVIEAETEAYGSMAIGNFTEDSVPDFFTSFAQGQWPNLGWSKQLMVDGKTGKIRLKDSLGYYQMSSAVAVDLNNDGKDEVLMPINYQETNSAYMKYFYNDLMVFDFKTKGAFQLKVQHEGSNLTSTPWIGDLDNNGFLDIIYVHGTNIKETYTFDGLQINRIDTDVPITKDIKWGSYMGTNTNGVYD